MEPSSPNVNLQGRWAIAVEGVVTKILIVVIEEIHANSTHEMGWFNPILAKAWKFIFPLMEASARMWSISLQDPAWQRMGSPWWIFKSDIQECRKVNDILWKKVSQLSSIPLLCEFNPSLELMEGRILRCQSISTSV